MFAQSLFGKSALGQYAITPTLLGTGLGGVYGAYEKATNPYARDPMSDYFIKEPYDWISCWRFRSLV